MWKSILMLTPTLSLVFSAALISAQFPSVTYALALQVGGTNMMMITCLLTLVATSSALPGATQVLTNLPKWQHIALWVDLK